MELPCSTSPSTLVLTPKITTNLPPDSDLELWGDMIKKDTKKAGKI